jgi:hypothetical protein
MSCGKAIMRSCGPNRSGNKREIFPCQETYTTHQLQAVAESEHEIEHLGRVISPLVISIPRYVIYLEPE